jgi:thiol-disulfide isomerase/thioredoxin
MRHSPRGRSAGAPRPRGGPGSRGLLPALAAAALAVGGCSTGSGAVDVNNGGEFRFVAGTPAGEVIAPDERAAAPEFGGTLLGDGARFSSTELAGDIAVLNFWGSWCPPCRVETPEFQEVYADVRDDGVSFLGLNVKESSEQFALAFVESEGIEFPSLYDPRGEVALAFRDYPANAIPSTIVLDREGRVAAVYTGEVSQEDLRAVLDRLLAEEG